MAAPISRVNILGTKICAINMTQAITAIDDWVAKRRQHYVCVTSVHGVMEGYDDPELQSIINAAGLVTPDGMPMVWISRWRGYNHVDRVYGPDLLLALCGHSGPRGYRHFFYGGGEGVPELLATRLQERFPELQVAGTYSPPFRAISRDEDRDIVERINASRPDIVWVGLSTPKQERWMADHIGRVRAPVLIGVGAAFDFISGLKKQAPRWMQRSGLEMLFRVATEPKRLGRRFLRSHPRFVRLVLVDLVRPAR